MTIFSFEWGFPVATDRKPPLPSPSGRSFHGHSTLGSCGRARGTSSYRRGKTFPSGSATISKSFKA